MKNARIYNPLDPIECLEVHLKKVVVTDYRGMRPDVDLAKFFVLNAKVLKEMYFGVVSSCNDKWMANQRKQLQLDNKASPGARFAFEHGPGNSPPAQIFWRMIPLSGLTSNISLDLLELLIDQKRDQ